MKIKNIFGLVSHHLGSFPRVWFTTIILLSLYGATTSALAFGAVAQGILGHRSGISAVSYDQPTPEKAREVALQGCWDAPAGDIGGRARECKVVAGYHGQYAEAFASFNVLPFYGFGDTAEAAKDAAEAACREGGGRECHRRINRSEPHLVRVQDTVATCISGTVLNENDAADTLDDSCDLCPAGEGRAGSQTECTVCPDGQFSNAERICGHCADNTVPNSDKTGCMPCGGDREAFNNNTECRCPDGYEGAIGNSGACTACADIIEFSNDNRTACLESRASPEVCAAKFQRFFPGGTCWPCGPHQQYVNNGGNGYCETCPSGTVQNADRADSCSACPDGQGRDRFVCTDCSDGLYSKDNGICTRCTGHTIPNADKTGCMACPGDREAVNDNTACGCPEGQQGPIGMSGVCTICGEAQISSLDRTSCVNSEEPSNAVCAAKSQVFWAGKCLECPIQTLYDESSNRCELCPKGRLQDPDNARNCLPCPAGQGVLAFDPSAGTTDDVCAECPVGTYSTGDGICRACSGDTITTTEGNTACRSCEDGREAIGDKTDCRCPAGQMGPIGVSGSCEACEEFSVSNTDRTSCISCPPGEARVGENNECTPCADGSVPSSDLSACNECRNGQFAQGKNVSCEPCPVGHVTAYRDRTRCEPCLTGSINPFPGTSTCFQCRHDSISNSDQTECLPCGDGHRPNYTLNYDHQTICEPCPTGTAGTDGVCHRCDVNAIAATPGQLECTVCPNNGSSNEGRTVCTSCDGSEIVVDGECQACPLGQTPNKNSDACIDFTVECFAFHIKKHNGAGGYCDFCPRGHVPEEGQVTCMACPEGSAPNGSLTLCQSCNGGTTTEDGHTCVCRDDQENFNHSCRCPAGQEDIVDPLTEVAFCALPIVEPVHPEYNMDECEDRNFDSSILQEESGGFAEFCNIRVDFVMEGETGNVPTASVRGGSAGVRNDTPPLPGEGSDKCLMRASPNYVNIEGHRSCEFIFGESAAFPEPTEEFTASSTQRLEVFFADGGETTPAVRRVRDPVISADVQVASNSNSGGTSSDSSNNNLLIAGLGAFAVVGGLTWALTDGDLSLLNVSPQFSFEHVRGVSNYTYGSRVEFKDEHWSTYWSASQTHDDGDASDWIYGAGASYSDGIWHASFSNRTQGLETDMSFSARVEQDFGSWGLSTGIDADWELDELNSDWTSRLSLDGSTTVRSWQLIPSAGFSWEEGSRFGEESYIRLDISREL